MNVIPLDSSRTAEVLALMELGAPYVRARTPSDYWLYASLFASTCPIALIDDHLAGAVIAFRSQENPGDIYIQDVMTHPAYRRRGVTRALIEAVRGKAVEWECRRLYLTSEPGNAPAHATWTALGFRNVPGDYTIGEVSVTIDYKGPGKDRAVYELLLNQAL